MNCVADSLYYSLHNDTPPKPNRGDTPSLLSNNRCSRAFKIQCNNVTHLLTKTWKIRRDRLPCDYQEDGRYKHVAHSNGCEMGSFVTFSKSDSVLFDMVKESVEDMECF